MIKFGIRQSFDRIDQIEDRYVDVSVPVEVALPYYWDIYEPIRTHLGEVAEKINFEKEALQLKMKKKQKNSQRC